MKPSKTIEHGFALEFFSKDSNFIMSVEGVFVSGLSRGTEHCQCDPGFSVNLMLCYFSFKFISHEELPTCVKLLEHDAAVNSFFLFASNLCSFHFNSQ